ncbi:nitroreductase [Maritalea porphyrae]|jgi:nitroreductase|uniref:nitroreductase family protein n=1 Tax=Maritalea porphyrae TaxID=880732 RepID=UPI0022AF5ACC|nr:nitroreductase [Maritalea porphyrae]MCZ4272794.1 nitroreductase [Maritalea porphyrae]
MSKNVEMVEYLKSRRSVTLPFLAEPGPSELELAELLEIASRVPDHGKLAPWRLVVVAGDQRGMAGDRLAELAKQRDPEISEEMLDVERNRFLPAPLTIGVISAVQAHPKVPAIEQQLSAGCVCFNLVHGANALGFAAQWVTRWFAFDDEAAAIFGAKDNEFFAGFVHIGTPSVVPQERPRPDVAEVVEYWRG